MTDETWLLDWDAAVLACSDLGLELPAVLAANQPLMTEPDGDPDRVRAQVRERAAAAGWIRRGRWDVDVEDALRVLCQSKRAVSGQSTISVEDGWPIVHVASNGGDAVRASPETDGLEFDTVPAGRWIDGVIEVFPWPATINSRFGSPSYPAKPKPSSGNDESFVDEIMQHPTHKFGETSDSRKVAALLREPRDRGGILTGQVRRDGQVQASEPLVWFDTPTGRYATVTTYAADGTAWHNWFPGDRTVLTDRLIRLLEDIEER